jgi:hypothetical protein
MHRPACADLHALEPPSALIRKPATMAVMMPCSGLTPDAMANAIASGSATMPTEMPAPMSCTRRERS